jgi:2-oxoglutarate ferredoxin oxidoreductase subunit beta
MQSSNPNSYLVENCSMPFCKGCGHTHVLRKLDDALSLLKLAPTDVCLVTDIGCIGLADGVFENIHSVHTTHGRSTAFATGIKMADSILAGNKLKVVVLIGDGGAMIGLLHLVQAALLNIDITVLLCNNFLFGMTGGQHSSFSPLEFITQTTPDGNMIPPIDMCKVLASSRAGFVARKLATDNDLTTIIAQAITTSGFSLVEIVELCTEHATTRNELTGSALRKTMDEQGHKLGILSDSRERIDFGGAYIERLHSPRHQTPLIIKEQSTSQYHSSLKEQVEIMIAGSAGERVQSSAAKLCNAALSCDLYCTQKNDNPVTQGSGFSLSEVILSPIEIHYTGIESPSVVIVVSLDGLTELQSRSTFSQLRPNCLLIIDEELPLPPTNAEIHRYPFRRKFGKDKAASKAIEYFLDQSGIVPAGVFKADVVRE